MTSLITGFALSVQPVSAETITTDTYGLDAGEVKIPTSDGSIPAYRAMPAQGAAFPDRARGAGGLWRARAHQGHLPPGKPQSERMRSLLIRPIALPLSLTSPAFRTMCRSRRKIILGPT